MIPLARAWLARFAILAICVGTPALLLRIGSKLNLASWIVSLSVPDDGRLFLAVLTIAAWIAWFVIATTLLFEIVSVLTKRRINWRLPGTSWFRPALVTLVLAAGGLALSASTASGPASSAPIGATHGDVSAAQGTNPTQAESETTAVVPTTTRSNTHSGSTWEYVTVAGDDLWSLAQHHLGDGLAWREIAAANPHIDASHDLAAGTKLRIPMTTKIAESSARSSPTKRNREQQPSPTPTHHDSSTRVSDPVRHEAPAMTVTVARGDTLWDLANTHLGDPTRWREIYHANQKVITDPNVIEVGWQLMIPTKPGGTALTSSTASAPRPASADTGEIKRPTPQLPVADQPPGASAGSQSKSGSAHETEPTAKDATASGDNTTGPAGEDASARTTEARRFAPNNEASIATGDSRTHSDAALSALGWVSSISGTLAAGVLVLIGRQRSRQLMARGLGRRVPAMPATAQSLARALDERSAGPGTLADGAPDPAPTSVVVGWDDMSGVSTLTELEANWLTVIVADSGLAQDAIFAMATSLTCSPWSGGTTHVIVGSEAPVLTDPDSPAKTITSTERGIADIEREVAKRKDVLTASLSELRADEDTAPAWEPIVYLFVKEVKGHELSRIAAATEHGVGIAAVVCQPGAPSLAGATILTYSGTRVTIGDQVFAAQLLNAPARHALIELASAALSDETTPAPWWSNDHDPTNVTPIRRPSITETPMIPSSTSDPKHPTLLMLGEVSLSGARGEPPNRALKQCEEYCAWLLANPGSTASTMRDQLGVAEATRRSNMSRLRTWLGADRGGDPYLPDAYSGRIELHHSVTSDWEQFSFAIAAGVNKSSKAALHSALSLVRGTPLADTAPWQWTWADELRTDMMSAIRDAAVVLARLAIESRDLELAGWALAKAEAAFLHDELVVSMRVRLAHELGDADAVRAHVMTLTRHAKSTGIDLSDDTVTLLQTVMEGRRRIREV